MKQITALISKTWKTASDNGQNSFQCLFIYSAKHTQNSAFLLSKPRI